jgi:hypothetical protein
MDVSVLTTAHGGMLIVRTGGYDQTTGEQYPNGTFDKIQYKIYDAKGKLVSTTNDDASGAVYRALLPVSFKPEYRVEVQANIRNHSGKKGTAVVRGAGTPVAAPDVDLHAQEINRLVDGTAVPPSPVLGGSTNTYVVDLENESATGIALNCVVVVDGHIPTLAHDGFSFVGSSSIYVGPSRTKPCTFTLTLPVGAHQVLVTALVADGFIDANPLNNFVLGTIEAKKAADVAVTQLVRVIEGEAPAIAPALGEVVAGGTHDFRATVTSPAGSLAAQATCSATLNGVAVPASQISWTNQTVSVAGGASSDCTFTLNLPQAGNFALAVTATAAGDPNSANNTAAGDIVVRSAGAGDATVNLEVAGINRIVAGELVSLGEVPSNVLASYVAGIRLVAGGNRESSGATCSAKATNSRTGAVVVIPGTVTGTASASTEALCAFQLSLSANGVADEVYTIAVTVNPIGATEVAPANNTTAGTQRAVVRSSISVSNVQMMVDGQVQAGTLNIQKGKTATYIVTFNNGSDQVTTYNCQVFAGQPGTLPQPLTVLTGAFVTANPGEDKTCTFTYTFSQIVAINFTVTAANASPLDANLGDNTAAFQTVAKGDQTFPAITSTNVHALQSWVTDDANTPLQVSEQSMGITRITLTFAATTAILGDFTLTGRVMTDGRELNAATWTVHDLLPGQGGFATCREGVDPGATMVTNYTLKLKICAQEVPGTPGVQAIYVEYSSVMPAPIANPGPSIMFGDALQFDVSLDWRLFGTTDHDHASALLSFPLEQGGTGFANSYQKTQTGEVTVIRNGGG